MKIRLEWISGIRPLESTFQIWFQVRINSSQYRIWIEIVSFFKENFWRIKKNATRWIIKIRLEWISGIRPLESTFQIWFQVRINSSQYRIWIEIVSFFKENFWRIKKNAIQWIIKIRLEWFSGILHLTSRIDLSNMIQVY